MKNIQLTFCLFLATTQFAISQKLPTMSFTSQVIYRLDYQPDSTDIKSKKYEDFVLLLNETNSVFKSQKMYLQDSALEADEKTGSFGNMAFAKSTHTDFRHSIFKDTSSVITTLDYVSRDRYIYTECKKSFDWQIMDDTHTIVGIKCQKAQTYFSGRTWVAWFAPEIPIADGPYKFNGLPGLILQISDTRGYYKFSIIQSNNTHANVVFSKKPSPIKISKEKYFVALKYYNENRLEVEQLNGMKITAGLEIAKKRFQDLLKMNNNPIELIK
jgi:GLPGLI family protein